MAGCEKSIAIDDMKSRIHLKQRRRGSGRSPDASCCRSPTPPRPLLALLLAATARGAGLTDAPIAAPALQYLDGAAWTLSNGSTTVAARVPGDVISDLAAAGVVSDPLFGANFRGDAWDASTWAYSTTFDLSEATLALLDAPGALFLLVLDSVKLAADATLNGVALPSATVFSAADACADQFVRLNATLPAGLLRATGNVLVVAFAPGADARNDCGRFMASSGGWDWAPQAATKTSAGAYTFSKGLARSVYIAATPAASAAITHIVPLVFYNGSYPTAPLSDSVAGPWTVSVTAHMLTPPGGASGLLRVAGSWGGTGGSASQHVALPAGESAMTLTLTAAVGAVQLWWPAGSGAQPLFDVAVTFVPDAADGASASALRRIGFRTFALVTDDDSDPAALQGVDGSGNLTMRFKVNGANVWARGANMIEMEELEGRHSVAAFERLVKSVAEGSMNTLRVWGGGTFLPDAFFDAADTAGIMLYHDTMYAQQGHSPQASETNAAELRHQVRRLSHHPSLMLWDACNECNGHGLYATFVMTTIVAEDSSRPPWPSCPSSGWLSGVDRLTSLANGSPLGLTPRAEPPAAATAALGLAEAMVSTNCTYWPNVDVNNGDMGPNAPGASPADCCSQCAANSTCNSATFFEGLCWFKPVSNRSSIFAGATSCFPAGHPLPPRPQPGPAPRNGVIETHGPYIEGGGFPNVNNNNPLAPYVPSIPPVLTMETVGVRVPGQFASEFGSNVFSSFESMSAQLAPEDWSINSPTWYWRDWPCNSHIVSFFGAQNFSAAAGAATLQRQLYLCMISQTLNMKSIIEERRSRNAWGTVIWQLGETWATGGWGSLEYGSVGAGQIEGGRWKPLHYVLRDVLFRDVLLACGADGSCLVKNDGALDNPDLQTATLTTALVHLATGAASEVSRQAVPPLPRGGGVTEWLCVNSTEGPPPACAGYAASLAAAGCAADGSDCLLSMTLTSASGATIAANHELLAAPSRLALPTARLSVTSVTDNGNGTATVALASSAPAYFVVLTTQAPGHFGANAMTILLPPAMNVSFEFWRSGADLALLASTLRVEHAQMYR